jgi:transcriptional regulator with XRE-family HTH domain
MQDNSTDWYGPDSATFGDRLAGAREAAGMAQAQLAKRLGIKKATLVAWEDDLSEPRANRLQMVAGVLNVSIVWLLTGEGDGAEAPDETPLPDGIGALYKELRELRLAMQAVTDRAALAEKRLRKVLKETA